MRSLHSRMGVLETHADMAYSNTITLEIMDSQAWKGRQGKRKCVKGGKGKSGSPMQVDSDNGYMGDYNYNYNYDAY